MNSDDDMPTGEGSSCSSSDFDALRPVVLSNDSPRKELDEKDLNAASSTGPPRSSTAASVDAEEDAEVNFESLPGYRKDPCNCCLFFTTPYSCQKGASCRYCHHEPDEQLNPPNSRPRKVRRERCKRRLQYLNSLLTINQGPEEVRDALQVEAQKHVYTRTIAQSLVTEHLRRQGASPAQLPVSTSMCRASIRFSL
ncbi:unnamed protein product [Durusdinium trenchii]|uniref:C3H1-type domain-containing protein n=2 Tax=Durusdinium trenchii TaxID=1381693 RepID=A0ABP0R488_9DINO